MKTLFAATAALLTSFTLAAADAPKSEGQAESEGLKRPVLVKRVAPTVTADQAVGLGKVRYLVSARITAEGVVEDAKVVESKAPEFDREVAAAVSQWKFSPALNGETPVEVRVVVPVEVDFSKAQEKFLARW